MSIAIPADLEAIRRSVLDVARGVLEAEDDPDGTYPDTPQGLPPPLAASRLRTVASRLALDEVETLVLRILIAAELDRAVQRVLRRLSAEKAGHGIGVDAIVTVVEGLTGDAIAPLRAFRSDARLVARGVVDILDDGAPALAQRVTIPARIVDHLTDPARKPPAPPAPMSIEPPLGATRLVWPSLRGGGDALAALRDAMTAVRIGEPLWLVGAEGSGRRTMLASIADEHEVRLLCVPYAAARKMPMRALVAQLWRERLLGDAVVCIHGVEPASISVDPSEAQAQEDELPRFVSALIATGLPLAFTSVAVPPTHELGAPVRVLRLAPPDPQQAIALWRRGLPEVPEVPELATRFRLPAGRIVGAVGAAQRLARDAGRAVVATDVSEAIALGVAQQVAVLGNHVQDRQTWDDVVLPPDTMASIKEIVARVKHRHHVLDEWGFREKLGKGLGLAALFAGPPGTGKTMIASLIARELGQDLYQIDLARIVSKWIGETEKNLSRVFDAAEGANVMLLFDEADAMFAKRTEVKSSNDRHANAEVNYLLQRVERFEGICILTTNLEGSIDPAFRRRLAFRIEFAMPDEHERLELWRRLVPTRAQVSRDIDFAHLAAEYELAGGNIRNALLRAAFLAATEHEPISMRHLQHAVKLEYRDAGKLTPGGTIHR